MGSAINLLPDGGLHIVGEKISNSSGGELVYVDPTTAKEAKAFSLAGAAEVDHAFQAAYKMFSLWYFMVFGFIASQGDTV